MKGRFGYPEAASEAGETPSTARMYDWGMAVTRDGCDVMEKRSVPRSMVTDRCTGMTCTVLRDRLVGNRPCLGLGAHLRPVAVVRALYIILRPHS